MLLSIVGAMNLDFLTMSLSLFCFNQGKRPTEPEVDGFKDAFYLTILTELTGHDSYSDNECRQF